MPQPEIPNTYNHFHHTSIQFQWSQIINSESKPSNQQLVLGTLRVRPFSVATSSNILAANTTSSLQEHTRAASSANRHSDSTKELGLFVLFPTSLPSSLTHTRMHARTRTHTHTHTIVYVHHNAVELK